MREWTTDPVLWKRRVSIICQLGRRGDTDLRLLRAAIEANLADKDFFIRKAIGWALREYAKYDMPWVVAYAERLGDRLSPLSRREALKHAPKRV
ncbi:MAG: DNA alkylation repair protein, partial [Dehalococcoidia bacterium]